MERLTIQAEKRTETGKGAARSLRRQAVVPAVLYREGKSLPIKIQKKELARFIHETAGEHVIVNIAFPDGETRVAIMKEHQVDPVGRELLHTDFFEVSMQEAIRVPVAVRLTGEAIGVKRDGGILQHVLNEIEIECLPDRIPGHMDVDVSNLAAGHSIHVGDISLPEGIKVLTPRTEVIALVAAAKVEEVAAAAPAETVEPEVIKKGKAAEEEKAEK
jgi:large subunit ribosomal protein L25